MAITLDRREELEAAKDLAANARAGQEAAETTLAELSARLAALEARVAAMESAAPDDTMSGEV